MDNQSHFFDISKKIASLALPMAGTQFINMASGFLCMTMLAELGHEVLAASALIFATQVSIMVTGMSLLFSLSVLVGHAHGAKNYPLIGNFLQQGWTLALLISGPIMLLLWHMGSLLLLLHQDPKIVSIIQIYFHAYVWAVIPGLLSTCNQQFGYGVRKKMLMVSTSVMSVGVLLITAHTLIFGEWGFPKLGVAGLGYAIAVQYTFFFLFSISVFYFGKSFKSFGLFKYRVHHGLEHFVQMFKLGWPISVQMGGEMLSFFVGGLMIGWLGTTALAAYQVVNQYNFLVLVPIFSLSQASGILVGHACGAKQFQDIKKLGIASIALSLMASAVVAFGFLVFPMQLARAYINVNNPANVDTLKLMVLIFSVMAISQIFDGLRNIFIGLLRGLFDTRFPMIIGLLVIWAIGVPLSYFFAFTMHYGAVGIALGGAIGMFIGASVMVCRWVRLTSHY